MYHENVTTNTNITFNDYNITTDNLNDFVKKWLQMRPPINSSLNRNKSDSSCSHYCQGFIKELFGSYISVHGYISLVVSMTWFCFKQKHIYSFSRLLLFIHLLGLHIWYNCKYTQCNCTDTKGYVKDANQYDIEMVSSSRYVCYDRVHSIHHLYVHIPW